MRRNNSEDWPYDKYQSYEKLVRDAASKWYFKEGFTTKNSMEYCLHDKSDWRNNIICDEVVDCIEEFSSLGEYSFPIHKYIHHGLSSQAMTFNLIGPLVCRNDYSFLEDIFLENGIIWPQGEINIFFELGDKCIFNENNGQPTSIDVVVSGDRNPIFIESKFTEKEFGKCSVFATGDCDGENPCNTGFENCYLNHIKRYYWSCLKRTGLIDSQLFRGPICPLANYYQFFREAMFALHYHGQYVLLYDERSPVFVSNSKLSGKTRGLWSFLCGMIPDNLVGSFKAITIQQILNAIEKTGRHSDWVCVFKEKYGFVS